MRALLLGLASMACAWTMATTAVAADPIKLRISCTATTDCLSAVVARDEGIFAKHGIDADVSLISINTNIPPAIVSGSIDVGGPTETVFLQAVDGGLDLVAIAGASAMDEEGNKAYSAVVRSGLQIKDARDFIGKKVGAPGIGAFLHVLFRKWLIEKGVDPAKVNFVEVTFPTMGDALKSGAVDAVLTAEPFVSRFKASGVGPTAVPYAADLNRTEPIISYVTTRAFAEAHPDAIKAFRASIEEGAKIVNTDHEKAGLAFAKFSKMPADIAKTIRPSIAKPDLKASDFTWWIETMKQQDMIQSTIDTSKLVLP